MFRDPFKWLIDIGLILATLLINTFTASITIITIFVILLADDWIHRNWP